MYKVKRIIRRLVNKYDGERNVELYKIEQYICEFDRDNAFSVISEIPELNDISIKELSEVMKNVDSGKTHIGNVTIKTESFVPRYEKKLTPDNEIYVRYILEDPDFVWDEDDEKDDWI